MNFKSQFTAQDDQLPVKVDFSYYAKNYDKVFGEFNYTNNANNVSPRNVYVGYGNTFYYQRNSTYIMEMPTNINTYNFSGNQDVIGGLKNLASLFSSEKDYSVKK
ncbi:MAG: hypothetical protein DI539_20350 [Flavobacterium psychrophilum]|nr:MAG: hypothetical protein DI539_20350 [Flavobacterium psychrophilum]